MVAQMRDNNDDKKEELTPKNILRILYKFYKEHLYPIQPLPSFRHVLMWALQSGEYSINHQFLFGKQLSLSAAEAAWQLRLDPQQSAKQWKIVQAAMIDVGQRGEDQHCPGTWAADGYSSDQFDELRMRISDERETANDERVRAMMNADDRREFNTPQRQPGVSGRAAAAAESVPGCITELATFLSNIETDDDGGNDGGDDGATAEPSPFRPMTPWAAEVANEMAARPRSPSEDSQRSRTESEVDNDLRNAQVRTRYADDECEEEPDRPLRRLRRRRH